MNKPVISNYRAISHCPMKFELAVPHYDWLAYTTTDINFYFFYFTISRIITKKKKKREIVQIRLTSSR